MGPAPGSRWNLGPPLRIVTRDVVVTTPSRRHGRVRILPRAVPTALAASPQLPNGAETVDAIPKWWALNRSRYEAGRRYYCGHRVP